MQIIKHTKDGQPIFYDKPKQVKYEVGRHTIAVVSFETFENFKRILSLNNDLNLILNKRDIAIAEVEIIGYSHNVLINATEEEQIQNVRYRIKVMHVYYDFSNFKLSKHFEIGTETDIHFRWVDVWGDYVKSKKSNFKKLGFAKYKEVFTFR